MKYPIGIQDFKTIIEGDYVYIDKTALIYSMANNGQTYFLSRPRRFGKSLLISTLKYYFEGERELFKGLAIDSLEKKWEKYPVFHLDFNGNMFEKPGALEAVIYDRVNSWEKSYGYMPNTQLSIGVRMADLIAYVHQTTGKRCVVLIDEYDKPLLDVMDTQLTMPDGKTTIEENNRFVLKGFYSAFKAANAHLQFVLLSGVTKFSQVSVFSGFNQPLDISMDDEFEAICGITTEEINRYLVSPICELAKAYDTDQEGMMCLLKAQYDGYHFGSGMADIYNPFSLLSALKMKRLDNYWFKTGTPTYLIRLLRHNHENLNELTGKYYRPADFSDYIADTEKPLPMIYQSGYLTIKGFNRRFNTFMLDFPNNEVKEGFVSLVANNYLQTKEDTTIEAMKWVQTLEAGDLGLFKKQLTAFFASIPYSMRRKENEKEKERYFHYTFYLIFRLLSTYTVLTEKEQSEGRADCIIETPNHVYIFEFKLDDTACTALRQIEDKGYARPYMADKRTIHQVGVSFSSETGTLKEWKTI